MRRIIVLGVFIITGLLVVYVIQIGRMEKKEKNADKSPYSLKATNEKVYDENGKEIKNFSKDTGNNLLKFKVHADIVRTPTKR